MCMQWYNAHKLFTLWDQGIFLTDMSLWEQVVYLVRNKYFMCSQSPVSFLRNKLWVLWEQRISLVRKISLCWRNLWKKMFYLLVEPNYLSRGNNLFILLEQVFCLSVWLVKTGVLALGSTKLFMLRMVKLVGTNVLSIYPACGNECLTK